MEVFSSKTDNKGRLMASVNPERERHGPRRYSLVSVYIICVGNIGCGSCDGGQGGAREDCRRLGAVEGGFIRRKLLGNRSHGGVGSNMAGRGHGRARSQSVQSGGLLQAHPWHLGPPVSAHLCPRCFSPWSVPSPLLPRTVCNVKEGPCEKTCHSSTWESSSP